MSFPRRGEFTAPDAPRLQRLPNPSAPTRRPLACWPRRCPAAGASRCRCCTTFRLVRLHRVRHMSPSRHNRGHMFTTILLVVGKREVSPVISGSRQRQARTAALLGRRTSRGTTFADVDDPTADAVPVGGDTSDVHGFRTPCLRMDGKSVDLGPVPVREGAPRPTS